MTEKIFKACIEYKNGTLFSNIIQIECKLIQIESVCVCACACVITISSERNFIFHWKVQVYTW